MNAQNSAQAGTPPLLDEFETDFLLYLESRLVEHRGRLRADQMQPEELLLAQRWSDSGFLCFTPLRADEVDYSRSHPETHRVSFSEHAWATAFNARRARAILSRTPAAWQGTTH